ncbi:MAG: translation initiation factor IF-3 [Candidatus Andersenbacteria bacterium]|nr:translation initiation factor IF-3 [Candidatus Andersenbacteria bacterium]
MRLIGRDGQQLGVVSLDEARAAAAAEGSDLVMVADQADPPVVRLLDLGKYLYNQRKKQAKQKTASKGGDIKGVRIGFQMGEHDWRIRLKQAIEFLDAGNKVRLEIRLRGREKGRLSMAERTMRDFIAALPSNVKIEDTISKSPRGLNVLLTR